MSAGIFGNSPSALHVAEWQWVILTAPPSASQHSSQSYFRNMHQTKAPSLKHFLGLQTACCTCKAPKAELLWPLLSHLDPLCLCLPHFPHRLPPSREVAPCNCIVLKSHLLGPAYPNLINQVPLPFPLMLEISVVSLASSEFSTSICCD